MKFSSCTFLILCLLPLIKGQARPRASSCCDTEMCLQNSMQQNIIRLGHAPAGASPSLNPLVYNPPMRYHINLPGFRINITLNNNELQGIGGAIVSDVRWNFCGNNTIITYVNTIPHVVHSSNYEAVGSIRDSEGELNIDETGRSTIILPLVFTHVVNLTTENTNGQETWRVQSATMLGSFRTARVDFRSSNPSDNNDRRNRVLMWINEHIGEILDNIRPEINALYNDLYDGFVRGNLEGHPVDALICPLAENEDPASARPCRTN